MRLGALQTQEADMRESSLAVTGNTVSVFQTLVAFLHVHFLENF